MRSSSPRLLGGQRHRAPADIAQPNEPSKCQGVLSRLALSPSTAACDVTTERWLEHEHEHDLGDPERDHGADEGVAAAAGVLEPQALASPEGGGS